MFGTSIKFQKKHVAFIGLLVVFVFTLILLQQSPGKPPDSISADLKDEYLKFDRTTHDEGLKNFNNDVMLLDVKETEENDLPSLKNGKSDVPVVIVDEHQEVIPYWYKAVDEGLMLKHGNTLVHIDGHSDMASPEDYNALRRFRYIPKAKRSSYLPLMQRNDVFIVSAIIKGLIKHVVWVTPSWYDESKYTTFSKSYLGSTVYKNNETILCECMQRKKKNGTSNMDCTIEYFDEKTEDEVQDHIKQQDCVKIRDYTFIIVSENKFMRLVNLQKVKNIFVDIDEDFFGVESGVKQLVESGIHLKSVNGIDDLLEIYCPESVKSEDELAEKIRNLFKYAITLDRKSEKMINMFSTKLFELTRAYFCKDADFDEKFLKIIASLSQKEFEVLSEAKYCRANSPVMKNNHPRFELCHGTIYPEDTLNQIYVGDENEIRTRGKQLSNMIQFIYNHTQPRLFTISRSLRDGYTPRRQQRSIEKTILENLDIAIKKQGKKMNVIYDDNLVFGKHGWS